MAHDMVCRVLNALTEGFAETCLMMEMRKDNRSLLVLMWPWAAS